MLAGTPTRAPTPTPMPTLPAARPIRAPAPTQIARTVASSAPAPSGSIEVRCVMVQAAVIGAGASLPRRRLRDAGNRFGSGGSGRLCEGEPSRSPPLTPPLALATPDPPLPDPAQLEDLEQDDDVDGRRDGDETDRRDEERRPEVPVAVGAEWHEARREGGARKDGAPGPEVQDRPALREADVGEAVVEVPGVRLVDGLAVLEAFRNHEGRVDDGHGESEQREEQPHRRRRLEQSLDRDRREREAEQHRSGVPHEDPRRVEVVPEEAEAPPGHEIGRA